MSEPESLEARVRALEAQVIVLKAENERLRGNQPSGDGGASSASASGSREGSSYVSKYMVEADAHFIDKHGGALMYQVEDVKPILDALLHQGVINNQEYSEICSQPDSFEKMRLILNNMGTHEAMDTLCDALMNENPSLMFFLAIRY